jgi:hypothetical protein
MIDYQDYMPIGVMRTTDDVDLRTGENEDTSGTGNQDDDSLKPIQ